LLRYTLQFSAVFLKESGGGDISLQPSGRGLIDVWELAHKQIEALSRKVAG